MLIREVGVEVLDVKVVLVVGRVVRVDAQVLGLAGLPPALVGAPVAVVALAGVDDVLLGLGVVEPGDAREEALGRRSGDGEEGGEDGDGGLHVG